ncbi:hypothetical protein MMC30_005169 [Trapelia coarctata]|nr:hypothetical protein [Trapelia coarctata]
MGPTSSKKRKLEDASNVRTSRPKRKFRKQSDYHSSSSPSGDEFAPVNLADTDSEAEASAKPRKPSKISRSTKKSKPHAPQSASSASSSASSSEAENSPSDTSQSPHPTRKLPKRHDPLAFSTSLTTILAAKLPTSTRSDPVLSRSKTAKEASHSISESKLEAKARKALRAEKKLASEKGRVRDVLLGDRPKASDIVIAAGGDNQGGSEGGKEAEGGTTAQQILEQERRLRKTAQRGVVKLFNAVRAAQVKGEEAAREARAKGLVGSKRREERVGEMGKQAFLELVAGGGKGVEGAA